MTRHILLQRILVSSHKSAARGSAFVIPHLKRNAFRAVVADSERAIYDAEHVFVADVVADSL